MSDTNTFRTTRTQKILGDSPERTVFERYAVKTSEKANMHNRVGLPRTDRPTQRHHNRGRVSIPACNLLAYVRLSASY